MSKRVDIWEEKLSEEDLMEVEERTAASKRWVERDRDRSFNLKQAKVEPWDGTMALPELGTNLGCGERGTAQVVSRTMMKDPLTGLYRRSVLLRVLRTRELFEAFGRECTPASLGEQKQQPQKKQRKGESMVEKKKLPAESADAEDGGDLTEREMAERLKASVKSLNEQKAQRRERTVKGSHLLERLLVLAKEAGVLEEDKSGFTKLTGGTKGRAIYIAKKGGRVDFSGFSVTSAAVHQLSEDDAKNKHLGKVRGQVNFDAEDEAILKAFSQALRELSSND